MSHLGDIFRVIADEPIDGQLDRLTWRAAFLAAGRIADEDHAKRNPESEKASR